MDSAARAAESALQNIISEADIITCNIFADSFRFYIHGQNHFFMHRYVLTLVGSKNGKKNNTVKKQVR